MKVIIAGGRDFTAVQAYVHVCLAVAQCGFADSISEIVSGGARGIDAAGEELSRVMSVPLKQFPADWNAHGKSAGPIRNREMADYADALIAVWDGKSKGTKNMIDEATKRGLKVYVYRVDATPSSTPPAAPHEPQGSH